MISTAEENYDNALREIYSFANYETRPDGMSSLRSAKLGRMARLLELLGHPEKAAPSLIVAGTKGKGSTAAMAAAVLRSAGKRTGLYSQPHLHSFRERIQVQGESIPKQDLVEMVARLRPAVEVVSQEPAGRPTTYELSTALMFEYFRLRRVEAMVVEVGIGGRLDAVNVIDPLVGAIASISYDHMDVLGNTLAEIAYEKAGIIKPGLRVAVGPQRDEAEAVIERRAGHVGATLWRVGREIQVRRAGSSVRSQQLAIETPVRVFPNLTIPLLGAFQCQNAGVAVGAVGLAEEAGMEGAGAGVEGGLAHVRWPGRLETISDDPLVIVDGAHNGDSCEKLVEALRELFPDRPLLFVVGSSRDKDLDAILRPLALAAHALIVTRSSHPRAAAPEALAQLVRAMRVTSVLSSTVADALNLAISLAPAGAVICATGSLFTVADAREHFGLGEPDRVRF